MNVVNKYLATFLLAGATLTAPALQANEPHTRDNPNLIQCDTCYSVADFEQKAKSQAQSNTAGYHLVYNMNTEVIETVYTFELYEPELGISISNARVVSTTALHAAQYNDFLDYVKLGATRAPKVLKMTHAGSYDGIVYNYYKPARAQWQLLKYNNFLPIIVVIEFDNKDVITVYSTNPRP